MRCSRLVLLVSVFTMASVAASAQQDDNRENKTGDLWRHAPSSIHSKNDVDDAHHHHHHHGRADVPQYSLSTAFENTGYSGPFALPSATRATATITATSAERGQFALLLQRDGSAGLRDHAARASLRVPLTSRLSVAGSATLSADSIINPTYRFNIAPSYILFFVPEGQKIFGQLSVSAETSRYKTADVFSLSPMLTIGSRASGFTLSAGYMFGHLYNANSVATFLSPNQALATTGPVISAFWPIDQQFSLAMTVMPKLKVSTLFLSEDSYLVRLSGSYKFQNGPRLGLSIQHGESQLNGVFLNRSLGVGASLTVGF